MKNSLADWKNSKVRKWEKIWENFINHQRKLHELSKTTTQASLSVSITALTALCLIQVVTIKVSVPIDSLVELKSTATNFTSVVKNIACLAPTINEVAIAATLKSEAKEIVIPLVAMTNEVAPVIEGAKLGIIDLVSWTDAINKAEVLPSPTDGIKKIPGLLPSYTGNIKLADFSASEQAIVNGSSNGTNSFYSGLFPSYHIYFNSQYLIPVIPLIIVSLRGLLVLACDIIHLIFTQAYSLFLQILWEPLIKKIPSTGPAESPAVLWRYHIRTNVRYWIAPNRGSAVSGGNTSGNNGGDDGDDGYREEKNYYEEFPSIGQGLVSLLRNIIAALRAILNIIRSILSGEQITMESLMRSMHIIEDGYPCWITNYWLQSFSGFHEWLLSSLRILARRSTVCALIYETIMDISYVNGILPYHIHELYNLGVVAESRAILTAIVDNTSRVLTQIESELPSIMLTSFFL